MSRDSGGAASADGFAEAFGCPVRNYLEMTAMKGATRRPMATTTKCVVMAMACLCAFAAAQDTMSVFDDEGDVVGGAPDTAMGPDELTALPSSSSDVTSAYPLTASGRQPPMSNIQKVSRMPKSLTDNGGGGGEATSTDTNYYYNNNNDTTMSTSSYSSDLEWLLNVYNLHQWNPVRLPAASSLSVQCRDVMRVYLESLRKGLFWAAKSECFLKFVPTIFTIL